LLLISGRVFPGGPRNIKDNARSYNTHRGVSTGGVGKGIEVEVTNGATVGVSAGVSNDEGAVFGGRIVASGAHAVRTIIIMHIPNSIFLISLVFNQNLP
jgi:hypothetical protein